MFIVETGTSKAAKIMSVVMGIALVLTGSFGALFTLHIYVSRPRLLRRVFVFSGISS